MVSVIIIVQFSLYSSKHITQELTLCVTVYNTIKIENRRCQYDLQKYSFSCRVVNI